MKIMRRLLAFLVVAFMVANTNTGVLAASDKDGDGKADEAIRVLSGLKIIGGYQEGTYNPEDSITRAAFCEIIVKVLGMEEDLKQETPEQIFMDVPVDMPQNAAINALYKMRIISGIGENTFNPGDPIQYEQVEKILVSLLGYDVYAENKGRYPTGYMVTAAEIGILKGVDSAQGENVTNGMAAKMVYNALTCDMMVREGYGASRKYSVVSGKTLLKEKMKAEKITGVVTGVRNSNLYGMESYGDDEIEIARVRYRFDSSLRVDDLLGKNVIAYLKNDEDTNLNRILYIFEDAAKNDFVQVSEDNIGGWSSRKYLEYKTSENGKYKKVTVDENASVLYNGVFLSNIQNIDETKLVPETGNVMLSDFDRDGRYDVVFVTAFTHYNVESVSKDTNRIYFKFNQMYEENPYIELDTEDTELSFRIIKEGNLLALGDLHQWDVLSVAASINSTGKKNIDVFVGSASLEGKITEISNDSITVSDQVYKVAKDYGNLGFPVLALDLTGKFYLNYEGKICGVDDTSGKKGIEFGYLANISILHKGLTKKVMFKIFSIKGEWLGVKGTDPVNVTTTQTPGTVLEKAYTEDLYTELVDDVKTQLTGNGAWRGGLVKYKLDEKGDLDSIYLTNDLSEISGFKGYDKDNFSLDFKVTGTNEQRFYMGTVGTRMFSDNTTKVFIVPNSIGNSVIQKNYKVGSTSLFGGNDFTVKNIKVYDVKEDRRISVVVQEVADVSGELVDMEAVPIVVDRVTTAMNKDGDQVYKLFGLQGGKDYSADTVAIDGSDPVQFDLAADNWHTGTNVQFSELRHGDVIQCTLNAAGQISDFRVLFRGDTSVYSEKWDTKDTRKDKTVAVPANSKMAQLHTVFGLVTEKNGNTLTVNAKGNGKTDKSYDKCYQMLNTVVYIYNTKTGKVSKAKFGDVALYDSVLIRSAWNITKEVLIVR